MYSARARSVLLLVGALSTASVARAQATSDAYFEFLMARRFEAAGDAAGAQAALERATRADPRAAEIWAELSAFHLRRSQPEEAERAAKSSLAIDEQNLEAHKALGLVYAGYTESSNARAVSAQQKAYITDAITHLERAATGPSGGSDLVLNYTLGRLYLRDGTPQKAVQSLTRSLNQNPGSVQLRLSLAQAYAGANDLPGAVRTLDEIVDDEPRVAAALAVYQEQSGLLSEAAATYTKALAVQPMNRELKFRRIAVLQSAKDYARAAAFASDARKQHPEDARFPRLQGRALFASGDRSAGVSVLEGAVRAFPKDIPTQYDLADVYRDAGRQADAERALRQILMAEPGHANALNYLGYLLALRGAQLDEAVQLVRRALDAEPTNGAYLDSLGWVHFRRGEYAEAEKYLTAAAERMPGNSEVYDHLGDVHARRGRWQDAISAWTRALEGDREDVDLPLIEKKLADARSRVRR